MPRADAKGMKLRASGSDVRPRQEKKGAETSIKTESKAKIKANVIHKYATPRATARQNHDDPTLSNARRKAAHHPTTFRDYEDPDIFETACGPASLGRDIRGQQYEASPTRSAARRSRPMVLVDNDCLPRLASRSAQTPVYAAVHTDRYVFW